MASVSGFGLFGAGYPAGQLLGGETSGLAVDFTARGGNLLMRAGTASGNYTGYPFVADGGPVSFSRASLGTVVDSDGKVKWAAHNLLTNSEQFDSSNWAKFSTTVAANTIAAPNGTTTAETVTASGANGTLLQTYTAVAAQYTFGIWLRRKTGTGNIDIAADSTSWTTKTITTDWAFYTVDQTPAAGSKSAGLRIVTSGDEVYAWGATLYRSDLGGMVANMSAYPMYNPTTAKNLLGFTEAFDNAAWLKTNVTATANATTAPNGLQTADLITGTASGASCSVNQTITTVGLTPYTTSVYVKAGNTAFCEVALIDQGTSNNRIRLTFATGAVTSVSGSPTNFSATSVGDGWYRVSLSYTFPASGTDTVSIYTSAAGASGSVGETLYVWGAQLSDSASLDPYVPNHFAAPSAAAYHGPRLDYDPATLAAKGLLVEEQRSNLCLQSAAFDNASWIKTDITVTADAIAAPDGTTTADLLTAGSAGTDGCSQNITSTANVTHTLSFFAKRGNSDWLFMRYGDASNQVRGWFNLANGTNGTPANAGTATGATQTIQSYGNGWYRCTLSGAVNNAITSYGINGFCVGSDGSTTRVNNSSRYMWGAQFELGSFATSYIPTTTASVTRSADVAQIGTAAFPYSATESTLVVSADVIGYVTNLTAGIATVSSSATNYYGVTLYTSTGLKANATLRTSSRVSGTFDADFSILSQPDLNTTYKLAAVYKQDDFAGCVNGGAISTDTLGNVPSGLTQLSIGQTFNANYLNGHIRQITYIPRRLTNAELQARTA